MTHTSIGGEKQAGISGGSHLPADIASGRAHIVRWTMVLRRPKRSVDLQRCAVEVFTGEKLEMNSVWMNPYQYRWCVKK